jgi:hypothetical protein
MKRMKPKVKGLVSSRDHLKIGEVAPQITFAKIRAIIANFAFDNFIVGMDSIFVILNDSEESLSSENSEDSAYQNIGDSEI